MNAHVRGLPQPVANCLAYSDLLAAASVCKSWRSSVTSLQEFTLMFSGSTRTHEPEEVSDQLRAFFKHVQSNNVLASVRLEIEPDREKRNSGIVFDVLNQHSNLLSELDLDVGRQPATVLQSAMVNIPSRLRELRLAVCPSIGGSLALLPDQIFRGGAPALTKLTLFGLWADKIIPAFVYVQDLTIEAAPFGLIVIQRLLFSLFPALRCLTVSEILPHTSQDIDMPNKSWKEDGLSDSSLRRTISIMDWQDNPKLCLRLPYPCSIQRNAGTDPCNWTTLTAAYGLMDMFVGSFDGTVSVRVRSRDRKRQIGSKRRMDKHGSSILLSMCLSPLASRISSLTVHSIMFFSALSIADEFPELCDIRIMVDPKCCTRERGRYAAFDSPRMHSEDGVRLASAVDGPTLSHSSGRNAFPQLKVVSVSCCGLSRDSKNVLIGADDLAIVASSLCLQLLHHRQRPALKLRHIKICDGKMTAKSVKNVFFSVEEA